MNTYIALLRGINVGGHNIIKMADLKICLQNEGFSDVQTYIQSGNVVLHSVESVRDIVLDKIETALRNTFDYHNPVVLISKEELDRINIEAPSGFGEDQENYKYEVLYLKPPLSASEVISEIPVRENVDLAWEGPGVIYYRRSSEHLTKSMLNKLTSKPIYQQMTIRNWRTTTKIYDIAKKNPS